LSAALKAADKSVGCFQSSRQICRLLHVKKGLRNWAYVFQGIFAFVEQLCHFSQLSQLFSRLKLISKMEFDWIHCNKCAAKVPNSVVTSCYHIFCPYCVTNGVIRQFLLACFIMQKINFCSICYDTRRGE
jgi:hypothetical protein